MVVYPNAKINLGLYVLNVRPDGLHNLETVFFPVPLRDTLEIRPLRMSNAPWELVLAGRRVEGEPKDNLIVRVFTSLQEEFHLPPTSLYLDKKIPTGAGLGGGSSDAAFMMMMLNEAFDLNLSKNEMKRRLSAIGADCAFFIDNKPAFATGTGSELSPLPAVSLKDKWLVLVKPPCSVSTRDAYADVACRQESPVDLREILQKPVGQWRGVVTNDFEHSVFPRYPLIGVIKDTLYDMHALYASMSGSGSAVFGIFDHQPYSDLGAVFKDCFVFQSRLI